MSDRFKRFTERACRVLTQAQEEATRLNPNFIGTEHLLLGLLHPDGNVATRVLNNLGIEAPKIRSIIEHLIQRGEQPPQGEIGLTPRAKKVVELAVDEARRLNHHYIGTEHILLGLVREGEGIAAGVLESLDVNLEKAREQVVQVLRQGLPPESIKVETTVSSKSAPLPTSSTTDKFERFTERARKVLTLAQEEAQRFTHNYIGTEHILLGLVREGDGVAGRVLKNLGVELTNVRSAVEFIIGRGDRAPQGDIGMTPRSKAVLELAVDEARRLKHHYVGTEHILLGLVREGSGIAAGVLESLGVNLEKVREQVIQVLEQSSYISVNFLDSRITNSSDLQNITNQLLQATGKAVEEAKVLGHPKTGTQHLLLALFKAEDSNAAKILQEFGITEEQLKQKLIELDDQED